MLLLFVSALLAAPPEINPHETQRVDPAKIHEYSRQEVKVEDFPASGRILDIGGGGEGIIGRLKGEQVVAIDLYAWGMNRTPQGPLKLVMDATDLQFLDAQFDTVTAFFTLMYMSPEQQVKAMREAHRVLRTGGKMRIWEAALPAKLPGEGKTIAVFPFTFLLPNETVRTGYGAPVCGRELDMDHYVRMAEEAGFHVVEKKAENRVIRLILERPATTPRS